MSPCGLAVDSMVLQHAPSTDQGFLDRRDPARQKAFVITTALVLSPLYSHPLSVCTLANLSETGTCQLLPLVTRILQEVLLRT